ncbi:MAG: M56 family metallopeptidase [Planctomycetota bacterium]
MIDAEALLVWLTVTSLRLVPVGAWVAAWICFSGRHRSREQAFAARIGLAVASFACVVPLTMPGAPQSLWAFDWRTESPAFEIEVAPLSSSRAVPEAVPILLRESSSFPWTRTIVAVWLLGVLAGAARWVVGLTRLQRIRRCAVPCEDTDWIAILAAGRARFSISRRPRLLVTSWSGAPAVTSLLRPEILLPLDRDQWSPERRRAVLFHELAHWKNGDRWLACLSTLLRLTFWFHPIVLALVKWQASTSERLCDRDAIHHAELDEVDYASHLVDVARTSTGSVRGASAFARAPELERRIRDLLATPDLTARRSRLAIGAAGLLLAATGGAVWVCAGTESTEPISAPTGWARVPWQLDRADWTRLSIEHRGTVWIRPAAETALVVHAATSSMARRWLAETEVTFEEDRCHVRQRRSSPATSDVWLELRVDRRIGVACLIERGRLVCESGSTPLEARIGTGQVELRSRAPLRSETRIEVGRGEIRIEVPKILARLEATCGLGAIDLTVRGRGSSADCRLEIGRGPLRIQMKEPSELHSPEELSLEASGLRAELRGSVTTTRLD